MRFTSVPQIRLLPVTLGVAAALFGLQAASVGEALWISAARASEQQQAEPQQAPAALPTEGEGENTVQQTVDLENADPTLMNRSELVLLGDLAKRRQALDAREQQITLRERLLEATEKRIEARIADLKALESQMNTLISQQEQQDNEQIGSLVGVYERMKAKDAARIFEKLDMDIQLAVAQRMKQTKMAPILAAMSPDAAKRLTMKLAETDPLPSLNP